MKLFGGKPKVRGEIGAFGLGDWWLKTFSAEEREYIENKYKPMSVGASNARPLTQGDILASTQSLGMFLMGLASWFENSPQDRSIARRMLQKSVEAVDPNKDVVGLHFTYQGLIEVWYRDRETVANALDEATKACQQQIAIAPQVAKSMKREFPQSPLPAHVGFQQLTIIYDKQRRYDEAIQVAREAKKQGWNGDWDARIERYEKKKLKQAK